MNTPAQGGYGGRPGPPEEPDWYALADRNEAEARRRKRLFVIGGGVLGTALAAGGVAAALALTGPDARPPASAAPSPTGAATADASPSASASAAPPTTPLGVISSTKWDKASVSVGTLFPAATLTVQGRTYTRLATDLDKDCTGSAAGGLTEALTGNGCYNVYRATYGNGAGLQVTVAVATFASDSRAAKAKNDGKGNALPLVKDKATPFCPGVTCATARNSLGRYAYFTVAGPTTGKVVADADTAAPQAVKDIAASVYDTLLERGRAGLADLPG
ncbi:hypothetical protein OG871_16425 [Kitasatospora sp. NBC_00374]|uniref:hypothetical protein n=1 Tax=Kitasatospora sp. NBC_00374 TaxID=2975964 RepID=UPI0032519A4D